MLIEIHYRHYQFYANMFVATAIAFACQRSAISNGVGPGWLDFSFIAIEAVFFYTSRDTLQKYYQRTRQLLSGPQGPKTATPKR